MRRILLPTALAATFLAAQPAAAATNLIENGDFGAQGGFSGDYLTLYSDTAPGNFGWTIVGSVDIFKTDSFLGGEPDPIGGDPYALDLVGAGTTGGIYQPFFTQAGKSYRVTFDFANNPFISGASMEVAFLGGGGYLTQNTVSHSGSTVGAMNWQTQSFEFTAVDDFSFISFKNLTGGQNGGMYLDNISVVDLSEQTAVPEPATWALMISGFGLAGAALRRRRLAGAAA